MCVNINLIRHIQQVNVQMLSTVSTLYSQILKSTKSSLCFMRAVDENKLTVGRHVFHDVSGRKVVPDKAKTATCLTTRDVKS